MINIYLILPYIEVMPKISTFVLQFGRIATVYL